MMVVGWDPSALIPAINSAIDAGIPVVRVDADVPGGFATRLTYCCTETVARSDGAHAGKRTPEKR
jgi:ABC-type sugar transport system substrate-binding protein